MSAKQVEALDGSSKKRKSSSEDADEDEDYFNAIEDGDFEEDTDDFKGKVSNDKKETKKLDAGNADKDDASLSKKKKSKEQVELLGGASESISAVALPSASISNDPFFMEEVTDESVGDATGAQSLKPIGNRAFLSKIGGRFGSRFETLTFNYLTFSFVKLSRLNFQFI